MLLLCFDKGVHMSKAEFFSDVQGLQSMWLTEEKTQPSASLTKWDGPVLAVFPGCAKGSSKATVSLLADHMKYSSYFLISAEKPLTINAI